MDLTIICPAYNEINFIDSLIESLCVNDGLTKEIFIVDGGSSDGTRDRVLKLMEVHKNLRLIDNIKRDATHAFNLGYKFSNGKCIAFIGAHAEYDPDYFKKALEYLNNKECDAVGGFLRQEGKSQIGKAIAMVMSNPFGVGNTEFRTVKKKGYVDSVAFAVYNKEIFESCGLMDESLPVNQDDEFHYRINKKGFRILMVPDMHATYYVRDSLRKLFRQYYRYGLYKPLVLKKVGGSLRLRHLAPSIFVLYILSLPLAIIFPFWIIPLLLYFSFILFTVISFRAKTLTKLYCLPVFPTLHLAYGTGFLLGIGKSSVTNEPLLTEPV